MRVCGEQNGSTQQGVCETRGSTRGARVERAVPFGGGAQNGRFHLATVAEHAIPRKAGRWNKRFHTGTARGTGDSTQGGCVQRTVPDGGLRVELYRFHAEGTHVTGGFLQGGACGTRGSQKGGAWNARFYAGACLEITVPRKGNAWNMGFHMGQVWNKRFHAEGARGTSGSSRGVCV